MIILLFLYYLNSWSKFPLFFPGTDSRWAILYSLTLCQQWCKMLLVFCSSEVSLLFTDLLKITLSQTARDFIKWLKILLLTAPSLMNFLNISYFFISYHLLPIFSTNYMHLLFLNPLCLHSKKLATVKGTKRENRKVIFRILFISTK